MAKNESFKEGLNCPEATKAQKEIAMETIRSEIFRAIGSTDLENTKGGLKIEEIVRTVGDKYNIEDTSEILEMMTGDLNSGEYLYKVDEDGDLVSNYSRSDILQKRFHDRKNGEANEILDNFVKKAQKIYDKLPEGKRDEIEAIRAEFSDYDWERNISWIDLAVRKVWGHHLEIRPKPEKIEDNTVEER